MYCPPTVGASSSNPVHWRMSSTRFVDSSSSAARAVVDGRVLRTDKFLLSDPAGRISIGASRRCSVLIRCSARAELRFCRIDFSGDAQRAGLAMRPKHLLIFGNPKGGTPLMVAEPTAGLDLPFKVLAWEDARGSYLAGLQHPRVHRCTARARCRVRQEPRCAPSVD